MTSWINWFVALKGNEIFCRVDDSFIQDSFNLTGLNSQFSYYEQAMLIILDMENDEEDEEVNESIDDRIEAEAESLYGLIHARFIITPRGLYMMYQKYINGEFGICPRVGCHGQYVLPTGSTDVPNAMSVRFYCPGCNELYTPSQRRYDSIDGAFFGTTFAHLFFLTYPDLLLNARQIAQPYVPRVFGFKLHKNAHRLTVEAGHKDLNTKPPTSALQPNEANENEA